MPPNRNRMTLGVQVGTLVAVMSCLTSCATVPKAPTALDDYAKKFHAAPGKSLIYVARGHGLGAGILFQVVLDGEAVGVIGPGTYFVLTTAPGDRTVAVLSAENEDQVKIRTEPGGLYFVRVWAKFGWKSARTWIKQIHAEAGMEAVRAASLAAASSADVRGGTGGASGD